MKLKLTDKLKFKINIKRKHYTEIQSETNNENNIKNEIIMN